MQMDVPKMLYHFYTTKKMPHDKATVTKVLFVGSNSQWRKCRGKGGEFPTWHAKCKTGPPISLPVGSMFFWF